MDTHSRRYNFRLEVNDAQAHYLAQNFGLARVAYNSVLDKRQTTYAAEGRSIGAAEASRLWTEIKNALPWLNKHHSAVVAQQALRDLDAAYAAFWNKNSQARYPRFKSRHGEQSVRYVRSGFRLKDGQLYLAKCKLPFKVRWSRQLPSNPTSVTVTRDARGRYSVSFVCERQTEPLVPLGNSVGIDLGLKDFATLNDGTLINNPTDLRPFYAKLAREQKALARKQKGSNRRAKQKLKVARLHGRIADIRRDYLHKLTTQLVRENQTIAIEDLDVRGMLTSRKADRKRNIRKGVGRSGFGEFRCMLEYKCDEYGRELILCPRFFPSSKMCSACGHVYDQLQLSDREWTCACGVTHDRDHNAAINILLAAGHAERQNGRRDGLRPTEPSLVGAVDEASTLSSVKAVA